MKKIIIGIGIATIVILSGIWIYLLFFDNSGANTDVFSLFNFGDTTDTTVSFEDLKIPEEEFPVVDVMSTAALRQLTTRPTIGHQEITTATSSNSIIYFVEAGTGHVYSIDLVSGTEERISNITVPNAEKSVISEDGSYVVTKTAEGMSSKLVIIELPTEETELDSFNLDVLVNSFSLTKNDELLYSIKTTNGLIGKVYNVTSDSTRTIFEVPFRDAVVLWGNKAEADHFVYPKASTRLQGFLYKITNGKIERTVASGYGLSAQASESFGVYSVQEGGTYKSYLLNNETDTKQGTFATLLPEKCVFSSSNTTISVCAVDLSMPTIGMPDAWYQGEFLSSDELVFVNWENDAVVSLVNIFNETGRKIDVTNLTLNQAVDRALFTSKADRTLWAYDITKPDLVE